MNFIEVFVYYFQAPIVLLFGLIGNVSGLILFKLRKPSNIGPRSMYSFLFVFDTLFLVTILNCYLNLAIKSNFICKIYMYFIYTIAPVSSMILVFILIERFLSIKYPVESNFLRQKLIQLAYIVVTILFNLCYYSVILFSYDIVPYENIRKNSTEIGCYFVDTSYKTIVSNMVIAHKIVLPFSLMIIFTVLLVYSVIRKKNLIMKSCSRKERAIFRKDVHLSILSILFNIIFISLNSPFAIVLYFIDFSDFLFLLASNIFYISYAVNFYIFISMNFVFQSGFLPQNSKQNSSEDENAINKENLLALT